MTAVLLEAVSPEVRMLSNTFDGGGGTWLAWGRRWKLAYNIGAPVCGYQKWCERVS